MRSWLLPVLLLVLAAAPAAAQLVLPGAVPPPPAGTKEWPAGEGQRPKPKGAAFRPAPSVDGILGRTLRLNGAAAGEIRFSRSGGELAVSELRLLGDSLAKPGEECGVALTPTSPIAAKPLGSAAGLLRYQLELPVCPFTFDVLDGAILVPKDAQACSFEEAECRVAPAGMWGTAGSEFTPEKIKELEQARRSAEAAERDDFRALAARTTDKARIKQVAADQAAFSSERDETCRSYEREAVHEFCGTRFTEARIAALQALLGETAAAVPRKHIKKGHGPATPAPSAAMLPDGQTEAPN